MSLIDPKDTKTSGFLRPTDMPDGKAVELKLLSYDKKAGGAFPDDDGNSFIWGWEIITPVMRKEFAKDDGSVIMNCNSLRLRQAIDEAGIEVGDTILLTSKGEGFKRDYEVVKKDK